MQTQIASQAKSKLLAFTKHTKPDYKSNWHHEHLCEVLDDFLAGKIKRLIITMGPQHGKSELGTRRLLSMALGLNPDLKIAGISYSPELAREFNRDVSSIINSPEYQELFPETVIPGPGRDARGNRKSNRSDKFQIVNHTGSYQSIGTGGGISGKTVDLLCIDDPIKGHANAKSKAKRDAIWNSYIDEWRTRLHNDAQQIIMTTRWHDDDLVGRILKAKEEGTLNEEWTVINYPTIKEYDNDDPEPHQSQRDIGEVLWPERHSEQSIYNARNLNPQSFNCLHQGRPTQAEGETVKREWIGTFNMQDLPDSVVWNTFVDGAFTEKTYNDPSGLVAWCYHAGDWYIRDANINLRKGTHALANNVFSFAKSNGVDYRGVIGVEPKASGQSLIDVMQNRFADSGIKVMAFAPPQNNKEIELGEVIHILRAGRVKVLDGAAWVPGFMDQLCSFPQVKHDESVDCIINMIKHEATSMESNRYCDGFFIQESDMQITQPELHLSFQSLHNGYANLLVSEITDTEVRVLRHFVIGNVANPLKELCQEFTLWVASQDVKPKSVVGYLRPLKTARSIQVFYRDAGSIEAELENYFSYDSMCMGLFKESRVFRRMASKIMEGQSEVKVRVDTSCVELISDHQHTKADSEGNKIRGDGNEGSPTDCLWSNFISVYFEELFIERD